MHLSFVSLIHMPPIIQPNRVEGKHFPSRQRLAAESVAWRPDSPALDYPHLQPPPRSVCVIHKSPVRRTLREHTRCSRNRKGCFGLCLTCSDFIFSSKVPAQQDHSLSSELIYLFHPQPFTHPTRMIFSGLETTENLRGFQSVCHCRTKGGQLSSIPGHQFHHG